MLNEIKEGQILFTGFTVNDLLERIGQLIDTKIGILPTKNQIEQSDYITRAEVSKILKISLPTLHDWTKQGWLIAYKMGTRVLYKRTEVETAISKVQLLKYKKGGTSHV
ncbi:MAG TPA: helix-turn-helix domain-containing protein [Chitinophagaceae bacterium]|nr:helix-turn-helix domain-containing protein [Chitinophagaceae bacterium]